MKRIPAHHDEKAGFMLYIKVREEKETLLSHCEQRTKSVFPLGVKRNPAYKKVENEGTKRKFWKGSMNENHFLCFSIAVAEG